MVLIHRGILNILSLVDKTVLGSNACFIIYINCELEKLLKQPKPQIPYV